jgi:hypothetical protein
MAEQEAPLNADELAAIRDRWQLRNKGRVVTVYGQAELFRQWVEHVAEDETRLLATVDAYRAIVERVAELGIDGILCECAYRDPHPTQHLSRCPVSEARALLGEE